MLDPFQAPTEQKDPHVDHPEHYNKGSIEVIDFLESLGIAEDFCAGNAIKYISRYRHKGTPLQDLKKARWYIERLIQMQSKDN